MEKPDNQELEAIVQLKMIPQFDKFMGWVQRNMETQHRLNDFTTNEFLLTKGSGSAMTLSEIISTVGKANESLQKRRT